MKMRKLDDNDDYVFGHGSSDYLIDTPLTVAQAVKTRLRLLLGEWYLDVSDGTPWQTQVQGYGTAGTRDLVLQERINGTPNVVELTGYFSTLNKQTRTFTVGGTVTTSYGTQVLFQTAYPQSQNT